jgi:hypothetical protein
VVQRIMFTDEAQRRRPSLTASPAHGLAAVHCFRLGLVQTG